MAINTGNVIVGTAQAYFALWGVGTAGQPEPAPADPSPSTALTGGSVTAGSTAFTVSAGLTSSMVGQTITGTGIPAGATVATYVSATSGTLSVPATATGSALALTVGGGIGYGVPWGGNWVPIGATDTGVTFSVNSSENKIYVEEQLTPALVTEENIDVTVEFTLTEDTIANMLLAYGMGTVAVQAATTQLIGKTTLTLGKTLTPYSIGFESNNVYGSGLFRRVYVPKMLSGGGKVDTMYRRAKAERMYPVSLDAICDPTTIQVWDQTSAHM